MIELAFFIERLGVLVQYMIERSGCHLQRFVVLQRFFVEESESFIKF
jgi:hypothetical protein